MLLIHNKTKTKKNDGINKQNEMAELNDYFYLLFFQSSMKYMEIPILKLSKKKKYTIIFISMQKQGISV